MIRYEYKVIPAPKRGQKAKGVKTPEARFALALESAMNLQVGDGWEFHRAETLPSEERAGLTSTTTVFRSVLVFRRPLAGDDAPALMITDQTDDAPEDSPTPEADPEAETADDSPHA